MSIPRGPEIEEADVTQTAEAMTEPGAVLVDVREAHEWRTGHVAGARHIPLAELPQQLESLPRAAPVYLICRSGSRSHTAGTYLKQAGYERPINVKGGMLAWQRAGLPVDR